MKMNYKNKFLFLSIFFLSCTSTVNTTNDSTQNVFAACKDSKIILLPHHLLVENYIRDMYEVLDEPETVIIISPDHFYQGADPISQPVETEHGFAIHRDFIEEYFNVPVSGFMIRPGTQKEKLDEFLRNKLSSYLAADISDKNSGDETLFVFSVDFSHELNGEDSKAHDVESIKIIEARATNEALNINADSPESIYLMLSLAEARAEQIKVLKYTNPALDAEINTTNNTTHIFACSQRAM